MDAPELLAFLRTEAQRASDTTLDEKRATALAFYRGDLFGDEVEGQSQAVTRDVSEVVDYMQVGILNAVLTSGKAVEFETEPDQEVGDDGQPIMDPPLAEGAQPRPRMVDYGEQATAAVAYQFFRRQNGYRILHDALKAGQLEKTGVVGTFAIPQRPRLEERVIEIDQLVADLDGETVDGLRVADKSFGVPGEFGEPLPLYQVTLEIPQPPIFRDMAVPNEFFRVSADATDLDEAAYVGHSTPVALSDLIAMGYDREEVETLYGGNNSTVLDTARDSDRGTNRSGDRRQNSERTVWLETEYPLYDMDGDGVAERLFVHRVGDKVLNVMPVDEQPYSVWSPFPMPHRIVGQSVADKTMDIQRIRSVLLRQALNSLYLTNMPRIGVSIGSVTEDTYDDLLNVSPGALVRFQGPIGPQPLAIQDSSGSSFQAMEMMSAERESRTGVTRQSQGLNPDTLNKTASGMAMLQANAQQIELYVARNFVEMLVAPMFAKRYRLMRTYGTPFRMKIEGKWQTIDPRKWPEDMDVRINVGLGTGDKTARLNARMNLLNIQKEAVQGGLRLVGEEELYQNVRAMIADSDIPGSPNDYIKDPASLPPAPEEPDADTAKVQSDHALEQARIQAQAQKDAGSLQLAMQRAEAESELRARQQEFDLQAAREKAQLDADLARDKANAEMVLAQERFAFERELAMQRLMMERESREDVLPALRPGGALDA